ASGALPPSSLATISSSSPSAASKLIALMSSLLVSDKVSRLRSRFDLGPRGPVCNRPGRFQPHQCPHMRGGARAEPGTVVAALGRRDDPPLATPSRDVHDPARHPGEVVGLPVEVGKRIAVVGVEPRREQNEVRPEILERWQDAPVIAL